ncbi:flagellar basal body P-ring formation chaperone FlgA [Sulfuriflexus mobilis]|uniref:flagellar basal body P-ring formation chaperone FlgA n=1 Tax=Sulfuriflexus mobilis TaxID=1811807 RepID=UPI0015584892|nr:flagellar basal body P-ring formation chaperone FlgA [Sulfuriflexus mobilis]
MINKHLIDNTDLRGLAHRPLIARVWQVLAVLLCLSAGQSQALEFQALEDIRQQAEAHVKDLLSQDSSDIEVRADRLDPRLRLAKCTDNTESYTHDAGRITQRMAVGIRCLDDNHRWSIFVPVNIKQFAEVVVSTQRLSRNTPIQAQQLTLERRAVNRLHGQYLTRLEEVVGQLPKSALAKGKVVSPRLLKQQNLVKRGQNVMILAENTQIQVRSQGTAMTSGRIGEVIRVKNLSTKKIVEGTVTSRGNVKINM